MIFWIYYEEIFTIAPVQSVDIFVVFSREALDVYLP
jgi:hypothetical protein